MKKRLIPTVLSIFMIFQCISPAFAAQKTLENQIKSEIQDAKAEMYETIYSQLESQGALEYLTAYEEILYPRIEAEVLARYNRTDSNLQITSANTNITRYAPNGGVATYTLEKVVPIKCVETFLDAEDGKQYIIDQDSTFEMLLENLLIYVAGSFLLADLQSKGFGALMLAMVYFGREGIDSIKAAGNCADILVMQQGNLEPSYLVVGWTHYPNIILWRDNIGSYSFEIF